MLKDRLLSRVPERHRPLATRLFAVLVIAFLIFEATRAWSVGRLLFPIWEQQMAVHINKILAHPPWIAAVGIGVFVLAVAAQVAVLFVAWRWLRRRLNRGGGRIGNTR